MNRSTAFFIPGLLLGAVSLTPACSIMPDYKNILEHKALSKVTVHGVLVRKDAGKVCNTDALLLSFMVTKAFGVQAAPGDTVVVGTPASSAACGVDYPLGTEVIVFTGTPWICQGSSDLPWTSQGSFNVQSPRQAQVDSIHGTVALRETGSQDAVASARSPSPIRSVHGGILFQNPAVPEARAKRADGRAVKR